MDLPRVYLPHNLIGEESYYMNCGYWHHAPATYDRACQDLIELLARKGGIKEGDEVLDLGCGYGDQDAYMAATYMPKRILGVNVSAYQVGVAKQRINGKPEAQRVTFAVGDAVKTGQADESFDVVMAVECSAHFHTRDVFLREAHRILRPGGRLVLCDVLASPYRPKPISRFIVRRLLGFWKAPAENLYDLDTYRQRIKAAGFLLTASESIREHVYQPLLAHALKLVRERRLPERMDLDLRLCYRTLLPLQEAWSYQIPLDYAYAVAVKA